MAYDAEYKKWTMEFSKRLRSAMEAKRLRAADLAKMTGIGKSDLSNYLSAKYLPKQDRLTLMANALEVAPEWLAALDTRMPVISNEPWDPETMEQEQDPSIVIVNRVMSASSREVNRKLKDMILLMLQEDFDHDGFRKK